MNLNEYDTVSNSVDKNKTWTDIKKYRLLSREIPYRRYYTIVERLNTMTNDIDYYLVLLDDKADAKVCYKTETDDYGRLVFKMFLVWKKSILNSLTHNINVVIDLIEHTDDGDIYKLDI